MVTTAAGHQVTTAPRINWGKSLLPTVLIGQENSASEISYENLLHEPQAKTVPTVRDMVHFAMKPLLKRLLLCTRKRSENGQWKEFDPDLPVYTMNMDGPVIISVWNCGEKVSCHPGRSFPIYL